MKTSSRPRTSFRFSYSVHHQLNMYALAASAAGVAVLALAPSSEAKVVYTKVHHWLYPPNSHYRLDLNHDGITDFVFQISLVMGAAKAVRAERCPSRRGARMQSWSRTRPPLGVRFLPPLFLLASRSKQTIGLR